MINYNHSWWYVSAITDKICTLRLSKDQKHRSNAELCLELKHFCKILHTDNNIKYLITPDGGHTITITLY